MRPAGRSTTNVIAKIRVREMAMRYRPSVNRPTTILGLLWRLAKHHPKCSLVVALGVAVLVSVASPHHTRDQALAEGCPLEQTWFQGDIHFSQQVEFDHDGRGVWSTDGMADDAPHQRVEFRWQSDGSVLTVVFVQPAERSRIGSSRGITSATVSASSSSTITFCPTSRPRPTTPIVRDPVLRDAVAKSTG